MGMWWHNKAVRIFLKSGDVKVVTKKTVIGDVLAMDLQTAQFFLEIGMHCLGCPSASGETIEEACMVHDTDADLLVEKINAFLKEQ